MGIDAGVIARGAAPSYVDLQDEDAKAIEAQTGRLRLATIAQQAQQAQAAAQRDAQLRAGLAGAYDPATGKIDANKVRGAYVGQGDLAGLTAFEKSQADQAKAQREAKGAELDFAIKGYTAVDRSLAGISALPPEQRAQAWAGERQKLANVLDAETLGELPEQVDDATIEQFRRAAMDGAQRAAVEQQEWERGQKEREFRYRIENDAANRGVTMRGQDLSAATASRGQDLTAQGRETSLSGVTGSLIAKMAAGGSLTPQEQQALEYAKPVDPMAALLRQSMPSAGFVQSPSPAMKAPPAPAAPPARLSSLMPGPAPSASPRMAAGAAPVAAPMQSRRAPPASGPRGGGKSSGGRNPLPAGYTPQRALTEARAVLKANPGARAEVANRLQSYGINPSLLGK